MTIEKTKKPRHLTPSQTIMVGFALMISIGTLLLSLPAASRSGESVGLLNALFTATSSNCLVGLVVVNTMAHWTWFGKIVILALIQFGALGFVTLMTLVMLATHRQITLRYRQVIQASFIQDSIGGMVKLVKRVILITVFFEAIGAVLLAVSFYTGSSMTLWESAYQGIFHSISAFCNAGVDNIGTESLAPFQSSIPVNLTVMALIVAGGLGFTVWSEIVDTVKNPHKKSLRQQIIHLSLHSKIVFVVTGVLILLGAAFFLCLEWSNPETLGALPPWQKVQAALFQSVTLRTTGFSTISQDGLTEASLSFSGVLMMIGGSSVGTAGGIKTVTVGVIIFAMLSVLKGHNKLEAFGRTMPLELLQKALTVVTTMLIVVFISTFLLLFTEQANPYPHTFFDLLLESCSAASTTGISMGITSHLSAAGKIVIIICMYMGRLSPLMLVVSLNMRLHTHMDGIHFPKERVIIG